MAQASVLTIRVPVDLKRRIEITAKEQGVSINQMAMYMFSREVSSFEAGNKISEYWRGFEKDEIFEGFDSVMEKIKKRKAPSWDRIKK
jgi:hypothetical protein